MAPSFVTLNWQKERGRQVQGCNNRLTVALYHKRKASVLVKAAKNVSQGMKLYDYSLRNRSYAKVRELGRQETKGKKGKKKIQE